MLSIITALYKTDRYLPGFLEKLKKFIQELQTQNIQAEVIFLPRDPSDFERKMLDTLKRYSWAREVVSPNPGLYGSWNSGVLAAKGNILGFWNVDDFRYPNAVMEGIGLINEGAELVYFPFRIRRYLKILGHDFLVHIQKIEKQVPEFSETTYPEFLHSMLCGPFFIFTKDLYHKVGPFDEQFKSSADFDWCIRAAKVSKKFKRCRELGGSFRVDGRGISSGNKDFILAENNTIFIRHNIEGKTKEVLPDLMSQYNPKVILFRDGKIPY